jgi:hypothetical protein
VSEAKRYHIQIVLQIIGAPEWANGGKPWNWAPQNPQDYANFAIAASKRYPSGASVDDLGRAFALTQLRAAGTG